LRVSAPVALVTGASRGIGRAIALGLAGAGADVAINFNRSPEAADEVASAVRALGRRAITIHGDVADHSTAPLLIERTVAELGGLDWLVCNAGGNVRRPFLEVSEAELQSILALNLLGPFRIAQAAARHMVANGGGRVVNVASISADRALAGLSAYQAAKAGIFMLTRGMALELAASNVRVNSVAPGLVETDLTAANLADPENRARRVGRIPMGRPGQPADIVGAVLFLLSDGAAFITGSTIVVDGGQTIQQ
jgi:NAD(P)-dependent dehydrogenase (short-subunit alcohol dehydrogenase family)